MKIRRYLMLVAACTFFLGKSFAANNEKPFVIPELQEWRGAHFPYRLVGKRFGCCPCR